MVRAPRISRCGSSFNSIRLSDALYVDKTGLLVVLCKDLSSKKRNVHVCTRPTRFGKTMNLSMIDRFFNVRYQGEKDVFEGLEISGHHEYDQFKNRYPVIQLDMRLVSAKSDDSVYGGLTEVIRTAYDDFYGLYGGEWMSERTERRFRKYMDDDLNPSEISSAILHLSKLLHDELKDDSGTRISRKPVILIDEYDHFLQGMGGKSQDEFDSIRDILSDFITISLKSNKDYSFGVMTGILTLSQTGMISGLNNPVIHNIFDEETGRFFGYTEDEVRNLVDMYVPEGIDKAKVLRDIKSMYDGYVFGGVEIYNPRSVNMYLADGVFDGPPGEYWERSRRNTFLDDLLLNSPESVQDRIATLVLEKGRTEEVSIFPSTVYQDVYNDRSSEDLLYSCLAVTGYLKAVPVSKSHGLVKIPCTVSLPSREVEHAYNNLIGTIRSRRIRGDRFFQCLLSYDSEGATEAFNERLKGLSTRDSWDHDRCKHNLYDYLIANGFVTRTEVPLGNGIIDVSVQGDRDSGIPDIHIEVTTADEAGCRDLDGILEACWRKFDERRYVDGDPHGMFVAFAWDRRFCRIGIRRASDFPDRN